MVYQLWQYLAESTQRFSSNPAVIGPQTVLTYAELDELSTKLAHVLRQRGIGRGERVGILLPKSPTGVVAMLGILKCGAAYVPVDPTMPMPRAAFVLGDCAVRALITVRSKLVRLRQHLDQLPSLETVVLADVTSTGVDEGGSGPRLVDWNAVMEAQPEGCAPVTGVESDPAYLLYTSGSTGKPKGVILSHRHAITFVEWGGRTFEVGPNDRLSNHAPHHFDLSVFDIYVALRSGAAVVLVPDQVSPFPVQLARWIGTEGITVWYSVPSALTRLLLHGELERFEYPQLRTVLFAGEVFPVKYLRQIMERMPHARFFNLYGPTETNVCTFCEVPRPLAPEVDAIPIGRACANADILVLDESGNAVTPSDEGELYVRGPLVMLGYWGLATRTQSALVSNPLQTAFDEKLYRTGDLVRCNPDGSFSFVGRRDHMVKSRGYRIELGEIEHVLYRHPNVKEAVVLALPDEEIGARLAAIVVPNGDEAVTRGDLQAFCLQQLPRYMVPETFVICQELPRTSTGKMDRIALAESLTLATSES